MTLFILRCHRNDLLTAQTPIGHGEVTSLMSIAGNPQFGNDGEDLAGTDHELRDSLSTVSADFILIWVRAWK